MHLRAAHCAGVLENTLGPKAVPTMSERCPVPQDIVGHGWISSGGVGSLAVFHGVRPCLHLVAHCADDHLVWPQSTSAMACRQCHELTYESTQKSGSVFYELIERPFKIRDQTAPGLRYLRAGRKRDRALRRMDWAGRAIKLGFQRIPGAVEILGPLWEWEKDHFRR